MFNTKYIFVTQALNQEVASFIIVYFNFYVIFLMKKNHSELF